MKNSTSKEVQTYIQINTTCNQKCIFCNRPPENSIKQIFKLEDIKKRIKLLTENPNASRVIFTGGEPLMFPKLPEVIKYAKQFNLKTEIQTNGTLLHTKIFELKEAGLDIINFAFHSHKIDISNKIRGNDHGFTEIIKNIKLANRLGFELHIIHVINSLNYQDLPDFIDYVHRLGLRPFWLNLSLVVPEGWAWENKWIIPRAKDVKPYLSKAMKKCKKYNIQFDVSEIVPLCHVKGFEDHAISTSFKMTNFEINDDYLTGKRVLDFTNPSAEHAAKAPQCTECTLNGICAGFYPKMETLFGVTDYIPRKDDPKPIYQKLVKK